MSHGCLNHNQHGQDGALALHSHQWQLLTCTSCVSSRTSGNGHQVTTSSEDRSDSDTEREQSMQRADTWRADMPCCSRNAGSVVAAGGAVSPPAASSQGRGTRDSRLEAEKSAVAEQLASTGAAVPLTPAAAPALPPAPPGCGAGCEAPQPVPLRPSLAAEPVLLSLAASRDADDRASSPCPPLLAASLLNPSRERAAVRCEFPAALRCPLREPGCAGVAPSRA